MRKNLIGSVIVLGTLLSEAAFSATKVLTELRYLDLNKCHTLVPGLVKRLENLEDRYRLIKIIESESALGLQKELWETKVELHENMRSFSEQGKFERICANHLRNAFRAIRTLEDNLQIYTLSKLPLTRNYPDHAFGRGNAQVNRNSAFKNIDLMKELQSGDIILSRGKAYTSAAIASLGEFDTQFSHMSVVYKDPQGKFWTVEAHIEVGSFVRPLKDHINDKNARTMIFRYDDQKLAAQAAEFIFKKVKKSSETTGNIEYDFAFDQGSSKQLFCSEVASHAFDVMSSYTVRLPMFKSRLQFKKPKFMKQLGITAQTSFVPADIEVDPRFSIVAEWSDANQMKDGLQKDAALQAMYKWSHELGYTLEQASSMDSLIYRNVAWPLRRVPYLQRYFDEKLPLNMSRQLVGYFGVLESVGDYLQELLLKKDEASIEKYGFPLSKRMKYQILETERLKDKKRLFPRLHRMYRKD